MTLSRSEQILAGIKGILDAGLTGDAAATVYRDRAEAIARGEMPAVAVDWDTQSDDVTSHATLTTTMPLEVDILISGTPLTLLADPIWVKVHELLMAEATGAPSLPTLPLVDRVHEDEEQTPRLRQVGYHSA